MIIPLPLVQDFARRLQINRHLIVDAAKAAQDSAAAVTTLVSQHCRVILVDRFLYST